MDEPNGPALEKLFKALQTDLADQEGGGNVFACNLKADRLKKQQLFKNGAPFP